MVFGFGKNRKSPVRDVSKSKKNEIESALSNTESTLNFLNKKQEILQNKIKECVNKAIECNNKGDRSSALGHLRRKKLFTEELSKLNTALMALETQSISLEGAQMQHMAISALTNSLNAQKHIQSTFNSDRFDDLMDELEESKEVQQEVFDTMTNSFATTTIEFEDELDELVNSSNTGQAGTNASPDLDSVLKDLSPPTNHKLNHNL